MLIWTEVPEPVDGHPTFPVDGGYTLVQAQPDKYGDSFLVYKLVDRKWYAAETTVDPNWRLPNPGDVK